MDSLSQAHRHRLSALERLTLCHVGLFLVALTWAFGGSGLWLVPDLTRFGSVSVLITLAALLWGESRSRINFSALGWLWPFVLFNGLVLVSLCTPNLRPMQSGPDTLLVPQGIPAWKPSAALPSAAAPALWLFDAIYLSCFNLALIVRQRRAVRGLLLFAMLNALVLAVFGTVQKLVHAPGLYFGRYPTRQVYFFSTFIYHNHWGAFVVLMTAVCLGLAWRYALRSEGRGIWQSPAFGGLIAVFFLAATAPLSGSRSCTLLMALLLAGSGVHWIGRLVRRRRRRRASLALPLSAAGLVIALAVASIGFLAWDTIAQRVALTEDQVAAMRTTGTVFRKTLYQDTWHMARDRIWFGWGMASFPYVFIIYNSQQPNPKDHLPIFYSAAHNDWLQAVAEHGLVGTVLLGLCGLVPVIGLRRYAGRSPLVPYLFAGCGLILLYAWVEFPFVNPAVAFSWWLCFFCAVRYAQLENGPDPSSAT